ncbi:MAG: nucleotidyltransferase [Lachnospiraceae bacterium]|nr:nucleotidyltransferase [Lachnospiraceae bacterium]
MKTVGIIAEYNPFHNGHAYQLAKAKEITGADYCIVIMSGNFVQRGIPAMMDKSIRTRAALQNGADLVIELPVYYATGSAEYFASGAVALLDKLGVTDTICFGSECGNVQVLSDLASALLNESDEFKDTLRKQLKIGHSYPQARNNALAITSPHLTEHINVLQAPNNILGIEYLKALKKRNSSIVPYTITRAGAGYHTEALHTEYSSALAIRQSITLKQNLDFIKEQVPDCVFDLMKQAYQKTFPILPEDISTLLPYKLMLEQEKGFVEYLDIDNDFSDRINKFIASYTDYTSFCEQLKSKNMTYTRVARNLLHILLNIYQTDMETFCVDDYVYYARMLGFRKDATPLLSAIKENSSIPLFSKLADSEQYITSENGKKMLQKDIQANHIYALLVQQKFKQELQNEYKTQVIIE